jgi:hypothetical protein
LVAVWAVSMDALRAGREEMQAVMPQDGTAASFSRLEGDQWMRLVASGETQGWYAGMVQVPRGTQDLVVNLPERELVIEVTMLDSWRPPPGVRITGLPSGLREPSLMGAPDLPFRRADDGSIHVLSIPEGCVLEVHGVAPNGREQVKRVEAATGGGPLRVAWP